MDQTQPCESRASSHYTTPFGDLAPSVHDVYLELLEEVQGDVREAGDIVSQSRVVDQLLDLHPLAPSSSVKAMLEAALVTASHRNSMLATELEGTYEDIRLVALIESAFDHLMLTTVDTGSTGGCDYDALARNVHTWA